MNKIIIPMTGFFIFIATTVYAQSSFMNKSNNDSRSRNKAPGSYHMMMYEQAEEEAQGKYAIITESPEEQEKKEESKAVDNDEGENTQPNE